jgi:hypothetical protein
MDCNAVKPDLRVRTGELESTTGMIIPSDFVTPRKAGITGTVIRVVPGHGGDVWFVKHDNTHEVAAYCFTELEPA